MSSISEWAVDKAAAKFGAKRMAFYIHSIRSGLGAERMLANLAKGLAERGHEIDLLLEDSKGDLLEELPPAIRVFDLGETSASPFVDRLLRVASLTLNVFRIAKPDPCGNVPFRVALYRFLFRRRPPLSALRRYLASRRPDSVVSFLNYPNVALLLAARFGTGRTRVYVNVRNHISASVAGAKSRRMREMPVLMRNLFPDADGIIAVSEGVAADIARLTDLPAQRVTTILNPVYREEIFQLAKAPVPHPWLGPERLPLVLAAGKMKPQKDFETLLRAFALLRRDRAARLVILGDGDGRPGLEALAESLGVRADMDLPGYVDNPFVFYRHASVFVLSSSWEGLPNVLIEAMACGCPVVSTDCPSGPWEILEGGRLGRLVPVGDSAALAAAIAETLDRPPPHRAPAAHTERFSLASIAQRYDTLLSGKGSEAS